MELTEQCWNAILKHTGTPFSYEVIFVDNASTDGTPEFLSNQTHTQSPSVNIIRNEKNIGFARACNQGAQASKGEYVVFLNNDTQVHENWLTPLVDELNSNRDTGVVGGCLLYADGTVQHAGVVIGRNRIPYHIFHTASPDDPMVSERRGYRIVTGACMAVRKTEFLSMNGFDEGYINGHEDVDLCLRYHENHQKIIYRPECKVTHFESQSEGRFEHCQANTERTYLRWYNKLTQDDFNYAFLESKRKTPDHPLSIAIKIPALDHRAEPDANTLKAEALAVKFSQMGHFCRIDFNDEWGRDDIDVDITVVFAGRTRYETKPYSRNVLWVENEKELASGDLKQYSLIVCPTAMESSLKTVCTHTKIIPISDRTTGSSSELAALESAMVRLSMTPPSGQVSTTVPEKVSILMATYNRKELISSAIDSVRSQTHDLWELIIVNDGGESAADIVNGYNDSRIIYHDEKHYSKGHAINTAFSLSSGNFIAYLDDDDLWLPNHLERALFFLRNLPQVDMTYSDMVETTLEQQGESWRKVRSRPLHTPQVSFHDLLECNCIPGITVVHTRALFEQTGGMDASLEVLVDFDFWRRLSMRTDPYHITSLTAERFFRQSPGTTGLGQITNLNTSSRRRYLANVCRILRKELPNFISKTIKEEQNFIRRKVQALFLMSQGDYFTDMDNPKRAAASYKLAGKHSLQLSRDLMEELHHSEKGK
nr:glycosyltransferase family 2 protein [Pseudodesulfovibrio sp.]